MKTQCFISLHRLRERPQRPTVIWAMDVSKQIVGMGAAHASGLLIAVIAHHVTEAAASECAWYFVAFTLDTTIGVALTMLLHKKIISLLHTSEHSWEDGNVIALPLPTEHESWKVAVIDCGQYGNPPLLRRWALQAGEWSLCVVVARALCGGLIAILAPLLQIVAAGLDAGFNGHPTILLFFVMICCPLLMNATQLLIQDAILKGRQRGGAGAVAVAVGYEEGHADRGLLLSDQSPYALNAVSEAKPSD
jgi:STIMATE family